MIEERQGFTVNPARPAAIASMCFFALSIPMQILGYAGTPESPLMAVALVGLPVLSALGMIATILFFGKRVWVSIIPVSIGVLGFVFKLIFDPRQVTVLHHTGAILLYAGIVVIVLLTVLYVIKTKWVVAGLFLVALFKHIFMDDLPVLFGKVDAIPAAMWFKEASMLCFMLAMFFFALAFEKKGR